MQLAAALVEAAQVVERHRPQLQPHLLGFEGLRIYSRVSGFIRKF